MLPSWISPTTLIDPDMGREQDPPHTNIHQRVVKREKKDEK
jgi:hypothetical protein